MSKVTLLFPLGPTKNESYMMDSLKNHACVLTNNWNIFEDNWSLVFFILPFLSASYISSAFFSLYCVTAPRFCAFSLMPGAAPWTCSGMNSVLTSKSFRKRRRKTWFKLPTMVKNTSSCVNTNSSDLSCHGHGTVYVTND